MADPARLASVRALLAHQGLDGFLVPRADEHLGEYVPPSAERLAWLTGFTGSAGLAAVLATVPDRLLDARGAYRLLRFSGAFHSDRPLPPGPGEPQDRRLEL